MISRFNRLNIKGLTLIEVLVAMAILSFGLLAIFGLQLTVIKANSSSKHMTSAIFLAEAKLEELKQTGFGNNSNGSDTVDQTGQAGTAFSRAWSITPNYQGSSDMEQITVTVNWTDQVRTHSVTIDTILSDTLD